MINVKMNIQKKAVNYTSILLIFLSLIILGLSSCANKLDMPKETNNITYCIDNFDVSKGSLRIRGWCFVTTNMMNSEIYIVLHGKNISKNNVYFKANIEERPDVAGAKQLNSLKVGFDNTIKQENVQQDSYQIGIYIDKTGEKSYQIIDKTVLRNMDGFSN